MPAPRKYEAANAFALELGARTAKNLATVDLCGSLVEPDATT
ncbi:hypothetical protein [Antribacter soli]|nr:hypothetical protein [Antribacter soli]